MYKLNIKKRMTGVVEKMANLFCLCWQFGRCRLRNKHDFNYFVSNLRHQYPTEALAALSLAGNKFIEKKVILDDEYERSCFIKIGDIEYDDDDIFFYMESEEELKEAYKDDFHEWKILECEQIEY